jgi:hypothetical protein
LSEYFSREPIERGTVRTTLPDTVDPSEVEHYHTDLSWKTWSREQHREVWVEARERVLNYLAKETDSVAIADYRRGPDHQPFDPPLSNYLTCRSQYPAYRSAGSCLCVAKPGANAENVDAFLTERGDAVVLLTSVGELNNHLKQQPVSDATLMEAARNTAHALCRTYDNCAFLYWTKEGRGPIPG